VNRNYDKLLVPTRNSSNNDEGKENGGDLAHPRSGSSEKFKRSGGGSKEEEEKQQGGRMDNMKEESEEDESKLSNEGLTTSNNDTTKKEDNDDSLPINTKATTLTINQQQSSVRQPQPQSPTLLQNRSSSSSSSRTSSTVVELKSQANHPGLMGYYNWKNTVTSLYRIFAIPSYSYDNDDDNDDACGEPQQQHIYDNREILQPTSTSTLTTHTSTTNNVSPSSFIIYLSLTSSSTTTSRIPLQLYSSDSGNTSRRSISISELRQQVSNVTCVPLESMRLVFGGKIIQETKSGGGGGGRDVITEYGLVNGCVIHVVGKPSSTPPQSTLSTSLVLTPSNNISRDNINTGVVPPSDVDWVFNDDTTTTTTARGRKQYYHPAVLPMHPSSERGKVPVYIEVTNHTTQHEIIKVYWIDYNGNEVYKGSIRGGGGIWTQTTYIGHPWIFRVGPGEEGVLLKYVPFRVIPSIVGDRSIIEEEEDEGGITMDGGIHRFELHDVPEIMMTNSCNNNNNDNSRRRNSIPVCWVEDKVLPESPLRVVGSSSATASSSSLSTDMINNAIRWSCQQIRREDVIRHGNGVASARVLLQYLKNIQLHPNKPKYRQLRVFNRTFQQTIYDTGARGVLLALGFEELYGYMECGSNTVLDPDRVRQVHDAIVIVNETLQIMEDGIDSTLLQPEGGDGYGRAGFGHADGMN
jgi:hypothetical protein